jgi:hypothetical protein
MKWIFGYGIVVLVFIIGFLTATIIATGSDRDRKGKGDN